MQVAIHNVFSTLPRICHVAPNNGADFLPSHQDTRR